MPDLSPKIIPCNERSKDLISFGEHALFILSPWNPYFNTKNMTNLYKWGTKNFMEIDFIIFDKPSIHNLRAFNYDESKIEKRVRREINALSNRLIKVIQSFGLNNVQARGKLKLWSQFEGTGPFDGTLSKLKEIFEKDPHFREKCLKFTENVISKFNIPGINYGRGNPHIAVKYLLEELPFYINAPGILSVSSSVWFYHKCNYFFDEELMNEQLGVPIHPRQGGAIISFSD